MAPQGGTSGRFAAIDETGLDVLGLFQGGVIGFLLMVNMLSSLPLTILTSLLRGQSYDIRNIEFVMWAPIANVLVLHFGLIGSPWRRRWIGLRPYSMVGIAAIFVIVGASSVAVPEVIYFVTPSRVVESVVVIAVQIVITITLSASLSYTIGMNEGRLAANPAVNCGPIFSWPMKTNGASRN